LTFFVLVATFLLVTVLSLPYWAARPDEFFENIMVEAHGLVFDLFVIGFFLTFFNKLGERDREIKRYNEEIGDYRGWDEKEATYRTVGLIRRLNNMAVTDIDLHNTFLQGADLRNADLHRADLRDADLHRADLHRADLRGADLRGAHLDGADLHNTDLRGADLVDTHLTKARYNDATRWPADFTPPGSAINTDHHRLSGANLRDVGLTGAHYNKRLANEALLHDLLNDEPDH